MFLGLIRPKVSYSCNSHGKFQPATCNLQNIPALLENIFYAIPDRNTTASVARLIGQGLEPIGPTQEISAFSHWWLLKWS